MSTRLKVLALAAIGIAAATIAVLTFPRAFPAIALENRLTQRTALAAADSFFRVHSLADSITRRAVLFRADREVLTFVDLAAGGPDSVNALVRGRDDAPFDWSVRAFEPGNVHEARVDFAPDGRVIGFNRKFADADERPTITPDSATALAREVLSRWLGDSSARWKVAATSYQTKKPSERVDRTVTFERTDRKIGDAPLRLDVVIAGNTPSEARPYVHIPDEFNRRYAEMRSANDLLSIISTVGAFIFMGLGIWTIRRFSYHGLLRWKPSLVAGGVIGALMSAGALNSLGSGWYDYDTATPAGIFQAMTLAGAVAVGVVMAVLVALTLVSAEAATRAAFPNHLDWWKIWGARGTREVAGQVGGGYVVATIAFAYVAVFYLITRSAFGWWVPSELLDDPNQIATPAPWLAGIGMSLQAGVWEEALFRALPLSLLSLWVGKRPNRTWWMAGGVVATALIFGFAHASYPSWPPYSRGVEIFLDACFWGVLFLRFGLLVVVLAHFVYDVVLFSLFTATGTAIEYRISAAIALAVLLAPALVVAWRFIVQRGFVPLAADARFGAWTKPVPEPPPVVVEQSVAQAALSGRSRQLALAAVVGAIVLAVTVPGREVRGPDFTADKSMALTVADSMVAARGVTPGEWRRLTTTSSDTQASLISFLEEHDLDTLAEPLARSYAPPAWWVVRYVHTTGSVSERAAEWRVRVYPDGKPLDIRHILPDSAPGDALAADSVRRIARRAFTAAGLDLENFRESDFDETPRPRRRDVQVTWTDTVLKLPAGANARAWVTVAGSEPLVVRRGIQLPETFLRAERAADTKFLAMAGLLGVILFGALVTGAIYAGKKRPALVTDQIVSGNAKWAFIAVVAASMLIGMLNDWPDAIYNYDTSSPWSTHLTMSAVIGLISPLVGVAVVLGFWNLMEMLRRRAGIPAWPNPTDGRATRDALVAGFGLGAVFELSSLVSSIGRTESIAGAPGTTLNQIAPLFNDLLGVPGIVAQVALAAIPLLVLVSVVRRNRSRWAIVAAAFALSLLLLAPVAGEIRSEAPSITEGGLAIAGLIASVGALVTWGPRSALTWIAAALTSAAIGGLHAAVAGNSSPVERASETLAVVVSLAALAWLIKYAHRRIAFAPTP